jgi:hypothetical protein
MKCTNDTSITDRLYIYGKNFIFQLSALVEEKKKIIRYSHHHLFLICPLMSIIEDQMEEAITDLGMISVCVSDEPKTFLN